jgi:hypothetical protein
LRGEKVKYVGQIPGQQVISLHGDQGLSPIELAAANISAAQRRAYMQAGQTMSKTDGSFPLLNMNWVHKAVMSYGRCPPEKRQALVARIRAAGEKFGGLNVPWLKNFLEAHSPGGSRDPGKKPPTKTYTVRPAP